MKLKKSDGCYTCHNDVSLFIQHDDVWQNKKEDSEPLVINYISARAKQMRTETLKKLAEDYKKDHPDFEFNVESIADRETYLQKIKILASSNELPDWFDADPEAFLKDFAKRI